MPNATIAQHPELSEGRCLYEYISGKILLINRVNASMQRGCECVHSLLVLRYLIINHTAMNECIRVAMHK